MSHSLSRVFVHLVWSTKQRARAIDVAFDEVLRELFAARAAKMAAAVSSVRADATEPDAQPADASMLHNRPNAAREHEG